MVTAGPENGYVGRHRDASRITPAPHQSTPAIAQPQQHQGWKPPKLNSAPVVTEDASRLLEQYQAPRKYTIPARGKNRDINKCKPNETKSKAPPSNSQDDSVSPVDTQDSQN